MSSFSFAPHEDDPLYSVKNPGMATAEGVTKGTLRGSAIGGVAGFLSGMHSGKGIRHTALTTMTGGLVGAGAGGALGYHNVDKKRDAIERAYGKTDPFELQKFSSLDEAYAAGAAFAMKLAATQAFDVSEKRASLLDVLSAARRV